MNSQSITPQSAEPDKISCKMSAKGMVCNQKSSPGPQDAIGSGNFCSHTWRKATPNAQPIPSKLPVHSSSCAQSFFGLMRAIIEPRSNTMRLGTHKAELAYSAKLADEVIWYQPAGLDWDLAPVVADAPNHAKLLTQLDDIIADVVKNTRSGDAVVIMSNGGFGGLHQKLITALQNNAV